MGGSSSKYADKVTIRISSPIYVGTLRADLNFFPLYFKNEFLPSNKIREIKVGDTFFDSDQHLFYKILDLCPRGVDCRCDEGYLKFNEEDYRKRSKSKKIDESTRKATEGLLEMIRMTKSSYLYDDETMVFPIVDKKPFLSDKVEKKKEATLVEMVISVPVHTSGSSFSIKDPKSFCLYFKEKYEGDEVKEGDYLFDSHFSLGYLLKRVQPRNSVVGRYTQMKFTLSDVLRSVAPSAATQKEKKKFYRERLEDIIGQDDAKKKCRIIMDYLKNPKVYEEWAPRNVLFYGPPGTGKTMTAKALAHECDRPIIMKVGTALMGRYSGQSAPKIKELFEEARKKAPAIVVIDEIDSIASSRENFGPIRGGLSELVTTLLGEMDGIHDSEGVVAIMVTNVSQQLDSAILSRFEDQIEFKLPSTTDLFRLYESYISKIPPHIAIRWENTKNQDIQRMARLSTYFSGRDVKAKVLKPLVQNAVESRRQEIALDEILVQIEAVKKEKGLVDVQDNSKQLYQ